VALVPQRGYTIIESLVVCALAGVLVSLAVPAAANVRSGLAAGVAARELTVVLRAAQARAQAHGARTRVEVGADGAVVALELHGERWERWGVARLPARVESNYPGGVVESVAAGWPTAAGQESPRAGSFKLLGPSPHSVVVQMAGCVRCL
jgi:prepilin-type N-terminal cleavage/methylation domain-containing protein